MFDARPILPFHSLVQKLPTRVEGGDGGAIQAPGPGAGLATAETVIYEAQPALIPTFLTLLIVILTAGLALIYLALKRQGTRYKITTQRVVVDSGIFSKKLDQLDLYRVTDFVVDRPFSQRIVGTGNIRLQTLDKTNPEVVLYALRTDVVALYEKIRVAVEASKAQRGVRVVDYE